MVQVEFGLYALMNCFLLAAPVKFSWIPRHTIWEQKGEEYRLAGGGGWWWNGGIGSLRTRKRKREITWPNQQQKNAKIQKLEVVVGIVKTRKEEIRKKNVKEETVVKTEKLAGL